MIFKSKKYRELEEQNEYFKEKNQELRQCAKNVFCSNCENSIRYYNSSFGEMFACKLKCQCDNFKEKAHKETSENK